MKRFRVRLPRLGLAVAAGALALHASLAYVLIGSKWNSARIVMDLELGSSGGTLIDGSTSWNQSAESALAEWNSRIRSSAFYVVRDSTAPAGLGNRINNVFFADSAYGFAFGRAIAITVYRISGAEIDEADIIFNANESWNSYGGPLVAAGNGGILLDLYRVALHESGHVLGLDHPDEWGQFVNAIMNSTISDVDTLQADDVAGAQDLYGSRRKSKRPVAIRQPAGSIIRTTRKTIRFKGTADPDRIDGVYLNNLNRKRRFLTLADGISNWSATVRLRRGRNRIRIHYLPTGANFVKRLKTVTVYRQ